MNPGNAYMWVFGDRLILLRVTEDSDLQWDRIGPADMRPMIRRFLRMHSFRLRDGLGVILL